MYKLIIIILLSAVNACAGSRLLVVSPMTSRSHTILSDALVQALLDAGHQVTYVTASPEVVARDRLAYVNISSVAQLATDNDRMRLMDAVAGAVPLNRVLRVGPTFAARALRHEAVQKMLADGYDSYDAVVAEWFYSGLLAPLAALYECPLIWYSAQDATWMNLQLVHEQPSATYTTDLQARSMIPREDTLGDRVHRLWRQALQTAWTYYTTHYVETPVYREIYGPLLKRRGLALPDYGTLIHNGSFLLLNSHPLVGHHMPLPQNAKYVGGHHIQVPPKPLPTSLQFLLDNAKHGAILFSLGSRLNSKDLPEQTKRDLVEMFSQLEQTVIWKIDQQLDNLPRNIYTMDWVPQTSVLNHSNTVLLISHGGFISYLEATYFGVPVIGIPLHGDQFLATDLTAARGRGLRVDYSDNLAHTLKHAIQQVLGNDSFYSNAKEAASIFQNSLVPPHQELLYWIELVINSRGATHMRSPALYVSVTHRLYLDILMAVLMILWFLSKVVKVILVHFRTDGEQDNKKNR